MKEFILAPRSREQNIRLGLIWTCVNYSLMLSALWLLFLGKRGELTAQGLLGLSLLGVLILLTLSFLVLTGQYRKFSFDPEFYRVPYLIHIPYLLLIFYMLGSLRLYYLLPFLLSATAVMVMSRFWINLVNGVLLSGELLLLTLIHVFKLQNTSLLTDLITVGIRCAAYIFYHFGIVIFLGYRDRLLSKYETVQQKQDQLIYLNQQLTAKNMSLASAHTQVNDQNEFLQQITEVSKIINSTLNFSQVMEMVIKNLQELFGFEIIALLLVNEKLGSLHFTRIHIPGIEKQKIDFLKNIVIPVDSETGGMSALVVQTQRTYYFEEISFSEEQRQEFIQNDYDRLGLEILNHKSLLMVPLVVRDKVIGIMHLGTFTASLKLSNADIAKVETFTSMVTTAIQNAKVYEALENEKSVIELQNLKIMEELKLAKVIQRGLIPHKTPFIKGAKLSARYEPMEELGGDFYDFIELPKKEQLGIFISDVSGHGVPSALITSMVKTIIDTAGAAQSEPRALLSYLNEKLFGQLSAYYLSAFYGIYDGDTRTFTYARAGHPYPVLLRGESILELKARGRLLGAFEKVEYEVCSIPLFPGDKILFYTDGLTEAAPIKSKKAHFQHQFEEVLCELSNAPLETLINGLYVRVLSHLAGQPFGDDLCLVGLEVLPE